MADRLLAEAPIFRYRLLSVAPSWHCDAHCRHCYIPSKLRRQDEFLPEIMEAALHRLPRDIQVVGFTGGELFLHPERFFWLLKKVNESGRLASVVTNALWARDPGRCEELLVEAFRCGLRRMVVSLDDYHRPEVPVSTVIRLLWRARELGMVVQVGGVGKKARRKLIQVRAGRELFGKLEMELLSDLDNVGQASSLAIDRVRSPNLKSCVGAKSPLVTPAGTVYACCSTRSFEIRNRVLVLGQVRKDPISEILERASKDYLLAALVVLGPAGLLKLLGRRLETKAASRCAQCILLLEDRGLTKALHRVIRSSKELRKEVVGRHMILETCYQPSLLPDLGIP